MPRRKGLAKTGGRRKGTPNRRTLDVIERLAELECDPIEGMALIALDPGVPVEVRGRMFSELAQYVAPKRKAVELTAEATAPGPRIVIVTAGKTCDTIADDGGAPTVVLPDNGRGLPG